MSEIEAGRLLAAALPYLRRYRGLLLESRSGAASEREQTALELGRLIAEIEQTVPDAPADGP